MSGILEPLLDSDGEPPKPKPPTPVEAHKGLRVRHRGTGIVGDIIKFKPQQVTLRDLNGREQAFPVRAGAFSVKGQIASLISPKRLAETTAAELTSSGSVTVRGHKAKVASPSRILVEGVHDAELVEKVWGDDLRVEGVAVEMLHGADDLVAVIAEFKPDANRRLGILLDHLVDNTKESRIADEASQANVMIRGHCFVDIWQAIRPEVVGIGAWPQIPKSEDWKEGVCKHLGFGGSPGELWRVLLSRVTSYRDLEPSLIGAVEELIDFVAPPPMDD